MDGDLMTVNLSGNDGKNMNTLFIINGIDSSQSTLLVENLKLGLPFEKFDNDTTTKMFQDNTVVEGVVDTNRGLVCVSNQEKMSENLATLANIRLAASDLQSASEDSLLTPSEIIMPNEDQETTFTVASDTVMTSTPTPTTFTTTESLNDIEQVATEGTLVIEEHPKKKTGGWPKGKKRKLTVNETAAPRAPTTGYVLFQQERRQIIKKTNPEIPFAEVTKILGYEWSRLPTEDKERYLERAEDDKKRYREELKLYQQSEGYQTYQKWKKLKSMSNENFHNQNGETPSFTIRTIEEEDTNELYCKVCDVYFISIHNKKEHLYGRQHLQALTGEIHKEARKQSHVSEDDSIFVNKDHNLSLRKKDRNVGNSQNPLRLQSATPSNVNQAVHDFITLNIARMQEISLLKKRLVDTKQNHEKLEKDLQELKNLEKKTEQVLRSAKAYYSSLVAQLDSLRMVPALFGVINF